VRYYKPLPYPKRMLVQDAIFWWQINQANKRAIVSWQAEAVNIMQIETGFSKRKCFRLLDELESMDDFWDWQGNKLIKTERRTK
jgi:hypothetical protein